MQDNYIGPMMKKISEEFEREINEEIKKYNITLTQSKVVLFLASSKDHTRTQKELEDWLQVSHPTTVTIVKSMQDKGIIDTYTDAKDKRMKNIKLTWGNDKVYADLVDRANQKETKLLDGFSETEVNQFREYMTRACRNMGID